VGKHPDRVSGVPTSGSPSERLDQPTYVTRKRRRRGVPTSGRPRHVRGTLWATAGVEVTLCGWQVASNAVERHASVTATDVQLDAAALRQLAAMALGAADELDGLAAQAACQH
jgi:hypothetical protein